MMVSPFASVLVFTVGVAASSAVAVTLLILLPRGMPRLSLRFSPVPAKALVAFFAGVSVVTVPMDARFGDYLFGFVDGVVKIFEWIRDSRGLRIHTRRFDHNGNVAAGDDAAVRILDVDAEHGALAGVLQQ